MNRIILFALILVLSLNIFGQGHQLTLEDVINIAKDRSPDALKAKHQFRADYWSYKTYKRSNLPQLSFEGTIPSVNRIFSKYKDKDGSVQYVNEENMTYSGNLVLNQRVGLTGGNVFVSSGLQQVQNFSSGTGSYLSTPINVGFNQPLFNYNPYKWDKKIEPIKYEQAQRVYIESMEQVALSSIQYYFDLLAAEVNLKIVDLNVANYDTLFQIAQGRYQSGKIAENELLQLELSLLKSKSEQERVHLNYENVLYNFRSYLRIKDDLKIELILPRYTLHQNVTYDQALTKALMYNPKNLEFEKRLLEAKANLNRSKTENGFNANLYAVLGLTQNAVELPDVYKNPNDQQQVTLGIQVPILDWGMRKGQVKMAESRMDLINESIEQERIDFNQSIFMRVSEYNMQQNQLLIAAKSDTVAFKSYDVTKKRYYLGKITVTDLNIAQNNMDGSKITYIRTLQKFWQTFYLLRKSTLFDFKSNLPIEVNFEEIYR